VTAELGRETRRVLLIEDHGDSREALQMLLELYGHRVFTATNGVDGLALAASASPDVVLVDIGLPDVDGYEVARRFRAAAFPHPSLVALSGYASDDHRARAEQAGFDAYLVKPVDVDQLVTMVLIRAEPRGNS